MKYNLLPSFLLSVQCSIFSGLETLINECVISPSGRIVGHWSKLQRSNPDHWSVDSYCDPILSRMWLDLVWRWSYISKHGRIFPNLVRYFQMRLEFHKCEAMKPCLTRRGLWDWSGGHYEWDETSWQSGEQLLHDSGRQWKLQLKNRDLETWSKKRQRWSSNTLWQ